MSTFPRVQIRKVAHLGTGHTPSRRVEEYWRDCTIPWLTLADVRQFRSGRVKRIAHTKEKVSALGVANSSAVVHRRGTVALSRTASVGFSCILDADMATSQDYVTWECGPRLDPDFLYWVLQGERRAILSNMIGSTHKTVYMPDVERLTTPLPPWTTQRAIADFLDTETARIDALISKKEKQFDLALEAVHASVRRELTTGLNVRDPLDIRPDDVLPKADVVPRRLAWSFGFGSGTTPRSGNPDFFGGGIPWVLTGDLNDGHLRNTSRTVTKLALQTHSPLVLHPRGSLLVAMYGATIGRLAILDVDATVNQACAVLSRRSPDHPEFVFYWLLAFRDELVARGRGSGQPNISQEVLRSVRIAFPPPDEQGRLIADFEARHAVAANLRERLSRQIGLLREHRQALITAAVTGQMDVPGVAA